MADSRLDDLLDRYQELLDDGRSPDLDELCRDCPELRTELGRRVDRLRRLGSLLGDAPPPEPEPLSLSDDKTWVTGAVAGDTTVEIPAPPGYEVIAPVGEGGMGVVYKARQLGLDRLVALKMILAGSRARAVDLARFRDEAQAIAALRHPNIVQIYEVGEYRDRPFFSLEFCAGGTLAKALNGEPQPAGPAAAMVEVLARAVHSAHERGIIHRDLKPGNVLLAIEHADKGDGASTMLGDVPSVSWLRAAVEAPQAAFKITDFGLAKRVNDDSGKTLDGSVMGTPCYMAPEQARGELRAIGPPTDVWALGAILYELLTGRPPFKGSTILETLEQVRERDPVPVHQLQPKVPPDLETICLKCLEKEPGRRYPSAEALATDLRLFLDHKPIKARPVRLATRVVRWGRREPRTAAMVAGLVFLAAALPSLSIGFRGALDRAHDRLVEAQKAREAANKEGRTARLAAETHRYYAAVYAAGRLRAQARPGWTWQAASEALSAAAADTPDREPAVVRTELAAAIGAIDLRPKRSVADAVLAGALAFSPDGRLAVAPQLASPAADLAFVAIVNPQTGATTKLPFKGTWNRELMDGPTALAFSPDGRWLFLGLRTGTVYRWDLSRATPTRTRWDAHSGDLTAFAFDPSSTRVYTAGHDGQVKQWAIAGPGRAPTAIWPPAPADPKGRHRTGLAYWPGRRPALFAFGPVGATLLDPDTLAERHPAGDRGLANIRGSCAMVAGHPATGTVVVAHGPDVEVYYWEGAVCEQVEALKDFQLRPAAAHAGNIDAIALHPRGGLLATISVDEGVAKLWDLAAGELVVRIAAPGGKAIAFSADGRTLAVGGDHETVLYELAGLRERTSLGHRGLPIRAVGHLADGRIATIAAQPLGRDPKRAAVVASAWDPDGSLVDTVVDRPDGPVGKGRYRIAGSPTSGWSVMLVGDRELVWQQTGRPPQRVNADLSHGRYADISLDPDGRAWSPEGPNWLAVRRPGSGEKHRTVLAALTIAAGRRDLVCVRAGAGLVVAGTEHGYLRVVPTDGGKARDCPCFLESGATLFTERANTVWAVDVTGDTTRAIAGTEDGQLWLAALPGGEPVAHWPAHTGRVTTVTFDPTGNWLASGGRDQDVHLWRRTPTGYELYLTLPAGRPVRQVLFSAGGDELLVLRDGDSAVRVWHLSELRKRFREAGLEE